MTKRIKESRLRKDMTLLEVANALGVSESTVQRYESGQIGNLKYDTVVKLSELFDVSPAYLMGWDDPEKNSTSNELAQLCKDVCGGDGSAEEMCELVSLYFGEEVSDTVRKFMLLDADDKKDIIDLMASKLSRDKYSNGTA